MAFRKRESIPHSAQFLGPQSIKPGNPASPYPSTLLNSSSTIEMEINFQPSAPPFLPIHVNCISSAASCFISGFFPDVEAFIHVPPHQNEFPRFADSISFSLNVIDTLMTFKSFPGRFISIQNQSIKSPTGQLIHFRPRFNRNRLDWADQINPSPAGYPARRWSGGPDGGSDTSATAAPTRPGNALMRFQQAPPAGDHWLGAAGSGRPSQCHLSAAAATSQ